MDFLELNKIPKNTDGTTLYDWAKFIAAESEEELDEIAGRNQEVKKAVVKFRELTADERTRDLYERREKARRDQAMFLRHTLFGVAQNALQMNMSFDDIARLTGLTYEEIENLSRGEI